jgi:hypothetical protein
MDIIFNNESPNIYYVESNNIEYIPFEHKNHLDPVIPCNFKSNDIEYIPFEQKNHLDPVIPCNFKDYEVLIKEPDNNS